MQNNLIEGDSSNKDHESLEWYYADKAGSRHGPFSFGEVGYIFIKLNNFNILIFLYCICESI